METGSDAAQRQALKDNVPAKGQLVVMFTKNVIEKVTKQRRRTVLTREAEDDEQGTLKKMKSDDASDGTWYACALVLVLSVVVCQ